jgi:hypothetical protein
MGKDKYARPNQKQHIVEDNTKQRKLLDFIDVHGKPPCLQK